MLKDEREYEAERERKAAQRRKKKQAMRNKYLSIITNFGCHYTCPYCIVKNNNINVPVTTVGGLNSLKQAIIENDIDIVSISGGGDPLFEIDKHQDWWRELNTILRDLDIPLEIHTSYINPWMVTCNFTRIVYHLHSKDQLNKVYKSKRGEIVRVVFVITEDMTEDDISEIADFVSHSTEIDELSFRQMVKPSYELSYHLHDFLKAGHQKNWWYITQCDYNLYYAENHVYTKYSDFMEGEQNAKC